MVEKRYVKCGQCGYVSNRESFAKYIDSHPKCPHCGNYDEDKFNYASEFEYLQFHEQSGLY